MYSGLISGLPFNDRFIGAAGEAAVLNISLVVFNNNRLLSTAGGDAEACRLSTPLSLVAARAAAAAAAAAANRKGMSADGGEEGDECGLCRFSITAVEEVCKSMGLSSSSVLVRYGLGGRPISSRRSNGGA